MGVTTPPPPGSCAHLYTTEGATGYLTIKLGGGAIMGTTQKFNPLLSAASFNPLHPLPTHSPSKNHTSTRPLSSNPATCAPSLPAVPQPYLRSLNSTQPHPNLLDLNFFHSHLLDASLSPSCLSRKPTDVSRMRAIRPKLAVFFTQENTKIKFFKVFTLLLK